MNFVDWMIGDSLQEIVQPLPGIGMVGFAAVKEVYAGRTSSKNVGGVVIDMIEARFAAHYRENTGAYRSTICGNVKRYEGHHAIGSNGYFAIRGREQQLIDSQGGARSDAYVRAKHPEPNYCLNLIRGVSRRNKRGRHFHEMSNLEFGEIYEYTGNFTEEYWKKKLNEMIEKSKSTYGYKL